MIENNDDSGRSKKPVGEWGIVIVVLVCLVSGFFTDSAPESLGLGLAVAAIVFGVYFLIQRRK